MKTALEMFIEKMVDVYGIDISQMNNCIYIHKQMEKEQIINAHGSKLKKSRGATNYEYWYTGEMYFNDNFNTNK